MPLHLSDRVPARWQNSPRSIHVGHNPADPRVRMVEEMAADQCASCSEGVHRYRCPDGQFAHPDDTYPEGYECEAHNTLRIAVDHGVPIYTGAELEFQEENGRRA